MKSTHIVKFAMNIPHSTLKILYTQGLDAQNPPLFLYLHAKLLISQAVHQPHPLKTINHKRLICEIF